MGTRFVIDNYGICDTQRKLTWSELCQTLNELWDENQKLRYENRKLREQIDKCEI